MISKELLSEVLFGRQKVDYIIKKDVPQGIYFQKKNLNTESYVNIYELANKAKKWAFNKYKVHLMSTLYARHSWVCSAQGDEPFEEANSEPEAIFKACERLLKGEV